MGTVQNRFMRLNREEIVAQVVDLLQSEITNKRGLKGAVIKRAYKSVKSIMPNADSVAVNLLLDDIVIVFDHHYAKWETHKQGTFPEYCEHNREDMAEYILYVADQKASQMKNKTFASAYGLIRGAARSDIEAVVPRIGTLISEKIQVS